MSCESGDFHTFQTYDHTSVLFLYLRDVQSHALAEWLLRALVQTRHRFRGFPTLIASNLAGANAIPQRV